MTRPSALRFVFLAVCTMVWLTSCTRVENYPKRLVGDWLDKNFETEAANDRYSFMINGDFHFQLYAGSDEEDIFGTYEVIDRDIILQVTSTQVNGEQVWQQDSNPRELIFTDRPTNDMVPARNLISTWVNRFPTIHLLNRWDMRIYFEGTDQEEMRLRRD